MRNVETAKELLGWLQKQDPELLIFTGGLFVIDDFTFTNDDDEERNATPEQFMKLNETRAIDKQIEYLSEEIFDLLSEIVWEEDN